MALPSAIEKVHFESDEYYDDDDDDDDLQRQ